MIWLYLYTWKRCIILSCNIIYIYIYIYWRSHWISSMNDWIMMRQVIGLWCEHLCTWTRNIWDVLAGDYSPLCSSCVVLISPNSCLQSLLVFCQFPQIYLYRLDVDSKFLHPIFKIQFKTNHIGALVKRQIALHISNAIFSWLALVVLLGRGILKALMRLLRSWRCVVRSLG